MSNSILNKFRKFEQIRFYVSLLVVGLLFVVVAGIVLAMPKTDYAEAEGVIQRIEQYYGTDAETEYRVYVSYTDSAGKKHADLEYPSYSSSMKEGGTVTVLYDPAAPENIQVPGGEFIPYIILVIGAIAIVASIVMLSKAKNKTPGNSPFEVTEQVVDPALAEQIKNDNEPMRDYYFHWTGKMNQSYVLETPEREAIYEAICDRIGVLKPYEYTFADRRTGICQSHKVTHTVTKSYGGGSEITTFSLVSNSHFKIDDKDNWDYLHDLGYMVELRHDGLKLNFDVMHYGVPVAFLEAAGVNILRDNARSVLGDKLPGTGLYKVSCRESDIEGVFAACFCVSRVEFF